MKTLDFWNTKIYVWSFFDKIFHYLWDKNVFLILDKKVYELYWGSLKEKSNIFVLERWENKKKLKTVEGLYSWLLEKWADRDSFLVGIWGWIVCDIAGFVACTYMRGINFALVPTTLLAQIDASIWGKNWVNFYWYKNVIWNFGQADFVLADPLFLHTLSEEDLACGFSEIIKHSLIKDKQFFGFLEKNSDDFKNLHNSFLENVIEKAIKIKLEIVRKDEKEKNIRKFLNFWHTLGHAIEKVYWINHWNAVAIGMVFASKISEKKWLITCEDNKRIVSLISNFDLPVKLNYKLNKIKLLDALKKDKKKKGDTLDFVLLDWLGKAFVENIDFKEIYDFFNILE